jgi:tetratricopeptide (TPR) repeat protein
MLSNYFDLGRLSSSKGNYTKAIDYYNKALPIAIKIRNKREEVRSYSSIGFQYKNLGYYTKSIEYLQKALVLNEPEINGDATVDIYNAFIDMYYNLSDIDKTLDYCNKALIHAKKKDNTKFEATIYSQMSSCYKNQKKYDEALENIKKSNDIYKINGNTASLSVNTLDLGGIYDAMGRKLDAHRCYQEALAYNRKFGTISNTAGALINIANLYAKVPDSLVIQMGINPSERYEKAAALATEALEMSRKIGAQNRIVSSLYTLSTIQEKSKDYAKAYDTYKQYIALKDSTSGDDVKKQITRKEIQYEFDKKETVFKYEQQLTAEQLEQQKLLTVQGEQALTLNQQALALSNKEKDLARLAFLKEQAEKQENEQALLVVQKDKDLAGVQILNLAKEKALQLQEIARKMPQLAF